MLDNFKYIKNVSEGVGTMHLYGQIGDSVDPKGNYTFGISGTSFAYEMQYLSGICDSINVRINSVGGSVLEGYSIISSILNCSKPVNTYIDGLAASISGVIALSGQKCYMMDYGTLMLHNPSGSPDKDMLALVKNTLVTILSNRCSKTPEQIDAMMEKETWLSADEAMKHGMVNEIISSGKKVKIEKTDSLYNMAIIYNKLINKTMNKTNQLLGLKNEAEESDQVLAIEVLKNSLSEMEAENAKLKSQVEAYNAEKEAKELAAKEALKNKATLLANNAVKEGKLKESEVENTIVNASKDEASFEFVSNMISRLGNTKEAAKVFDVKNVKDANTEDRTKWTYSDWETKDVDGLKNMYVNDREKFNELANNYNK
jgi:ATP-dependent Clp protease protease subunit